MEDEAFLFFRSYRDRYRRTPVLSISFTMFSLCSSLAHSMNPRLLIVLTGALLLGSGPTLAQTENVRTVAGPGPGEETTLTATPHRLDNGLSARALGVAGEDTTRWALRLLGADADAPIHITVGEDTIRVADVEGPGEGNVGPTTVFVERDGFLRMAELGNVNLTVGEITTSLPDALRKEMKTIFERVSG